MNFETVATNFLKYFRHARNLSDNTLKAYEQDIAELRRYLAVQGLPTVNSPEDINGYIEWLSSRRICPRRPSSAGSPVRKPCSGCGRLARTAAIKPSVYGPMDAAQRRKRSGVHSAYRRWELGM